MTCPYEDQQCPKIEEVRSDMTEIKEDFKAMKYCLYAVVLFLAMKFGFEFLEVFIHG